MKSETSPLPRYAAVEARRRECQRRQTALRALLESGGNFQTARDLLLEQHSALHSSAVSDGTVRSLEDEVFAGLSDEQARRTPSGQEHSIVWLVWHAARCEDITLNLLVAGSPQVLLTGGWPARMRTDAVDTGNTMSPQELERFSQAAEVSAVRAYRAAVGRRTREIVAGLVEEQLARKVQPERMRRVWAEGALLPGAEWLDRYWSNRTTAGLLLMPATRHNLVHLNEAWAVKRMLAADLK